MFVHSYSWYACQMHIFNWFLEFLRLTTAVVIVEAHSQSKNVEVWTKIEGSSTTGELFVINHIVVYKGKSGHQNCTDWRKTCPQMVSHISHPQFWAQNFSKKLQLIHEFLWYTSIWSYWWCLTIFTILFCNGQGN